MTQLSKEEYTQFIHYGTLLQINSSVLGSRENQNLICLMRINCIPHYQLMKHEQIVVVCYCMENCFGCSLFSSNRSISTSSST